MTDHSQHGRGTAEDGPDDPDCPCRDTDDQQDCADAGCGFCKSSQRFDDFSEEIEDDLFEDQEPGNMPTPRRRR